MLLRGYSTTGMKVHAVEPLARDGHPLAHGHSPKRALCGAYVAVRSVPWTPRLSHLCEHCKRSAKSAYPDRY